ncbi:hypothetical protein FQA39_LY03697 [Lamprigera yunnana]|nr:hypothetical protein FQA39_LY03697 [Lamprigera yunnana]
MANNKEKDAKRLIAKLKLLFGELNNFTEFAMVVKAEETDPSIWKQLACSSQCSPEENLIRYALIPYGITGRIGCNTILKESSFKINLFLIRNYIVNNLMFALPYKMQPILRVLIYCCVAVAAITVSDDSCKCWREYEAQMVDGKMRCVGLRVRHIMPCNVPQPPKCVCQNATAIVTNANGTFCAKNVNNTRVLEPCENKAEWEKFNTEMREYKKSARAFY